MSYFSSTEASSVINVPNRNSVGLLSQRSVAESTSVAEGGSLWTYNSSNLTTDIAVAGGGFFTDGARLGMRNGDILIVNTYSTESSTGSILLIGTVTGVSTADDTASMSTEGFISSTATAAGGG